MKHVLTLLAAATMSVVASAQYSTPVREVDVPAKSPFVLNFTCAETADSVDCTPNKAIPAGYRFVIEMVNFLFDEKTNSYANLLFALESGGANSMVRLPPTSRTLTLSANNNTPLYARSIGAHHLKLYVDTLYHAQMEFYQKSPVSGLVPSLSMFGYLVKK